MHRLLAIALSLVFPILATGQPNDVQRELSQAFQSKQLKLKVPASGNSLKFDSMGKRLKGNRGVFGLDDRIFVDSIEVGEKEVRIKGTRMVTLVYPVSSKFDLVGSDHVDLKIELAPGEISFANVQAVMQNVFATPPETAARTCPPDELARFKAPKLEGSFGTVSQPPSDNATMECMPSGGRGYRMGKDSKPPAAINTPDPEYPLELRKNNRSPALVIFCIRVDEKGDVTDVVPVASPELRDAFTAGSVLRRWKFKPGTLGGNPVPTLVNVEINLRLY